MRVRIPSKGIILLQLTSSEWVASKQSMSPSHSQSVGRHSRPTTVWWHSNSFVRSHSRLAGEGGREGGSEGGRGREGGKLRNS